MLGSIEELEKDIKLFQQNVAASGELQMLLKQMLNQIKQQNTEFGTQSSALISRIDNLPVTIENANISSNNRVKNDVATEIDRALQFFANEQNRYLQGLEQTKQQVQSYIEQSQSQEKTFSDKTEVIVTKVDGIPVAVEAENLKSNARIKSDVETALQGALQKFAEEQEKYLQGLKQTKQQIQSYIEQSQSQEKTFSDKTEIIVTKVDGIPVAVEEENKKSNAQIKSDVETALQGALQKLAEEQEKYLQAIENTKQQIQGLMNQSSAQGKAFAEGVASAICKFDELAKRVVDDNSSANTVLKDNIDKLLADRNIKFTEEQDKYIASLQQTQSEIKNCERQLTTKYTEFIDMLQRMNISNLYDQNIELKNELNKRTTILMIISAISIFVGIVGIFM